MERAHLSRRLRHMAADPCDFKHRIDEPVRNAVA